MNYILIIEVIVMAVFRVLFYNWYDYVNWIKDAL